MHKKYDLRPRKKESIQDSKLQPKNHSPSYLKDKFKELYEIPKDNEVLEPSK
jgi:hypothetical protein